MKLKVGQIFWYPVTYPATGHTETRPVVIVEINENDVVFAIFAEITGSNIKDMNGKYDKWKVPLFKWAEYNMEKGSFVKANCVAEVEAVTFVGRSYIGMMDRMDLHNTYKKIKEFIESGENPW